MEELKNKFLFLDTNILIFASRNKDVAEPFFKKLKSLNTVPLIDETVCFEFLRGAFDKESRKDFESFIQELTETDVKDAVPVKKETFDTATLIANIYTRNKKNGIEASDCLIAAQLAKYSKSSVGHAYLATINHSDFPPVMFDIIEAFPVFTKNNPGCCMYILQFNQTKFAAEKAKFN